MPPGTGPPLFAPQRADDLSSHALRQAIGYVGVLLPVLLWLVARWRTEEGFPRWRPLDSISEYYHSGAVAILTGALAALAVFLFTYRGYQNAGKRWDQLTGKIACFAALGVSFFPTVAISPFRPPLWWSPWMGMVHFASAATLFASFIFYSLFLFPMSDPKSGVRTPSKKKRNLIYRACGVGMVICVAWAAIGHVLLRAIFWPETLALWLFGVSWLTKGRAEWTLAAVGKRIWSRRKDSGAPS